MSEKLQIGIYKIKDELIELKNGIRPKKVIVNIQYLQKLFKEKGYKQQSTQANLSNAYEVYLFFKKNSSGIRWKEFIGNIAESQAAILKSKITYNESYILVLNNVTSNKIYATTGGFGHTVLQGIVEGDFGLEILSRLLKAEDKTLRSTKEKNLTGGILGEVKFFRNDYNLNENENFGNFYQELQSSLDRSQLIKIFGFSQSEIDSGCLCVAKNSFMIKKSIDFQQLLGIVEKCENLIETVSPIVEINGVKKLNKSHKGLIKDLENELDKSIFQYYDGNESDISIEICHKDFDKYLHADSFVLNYKVNNSNITIELDEPINNMTQVIDDIKKHDAGISRKKLLALISNSHIISKDSNGQQITEDLLKNHFYTEVNFEANSYFLSDKEWFEIKASFTKKLNEQCKDFIAENKSIIPMNYSWNYPTEKENEFNAKYIGENNFLVFDTFTPENIEACDILYWDSSNVYFIHVKAGFNNSMRDLSHQVYIAARRLKEDAKTGYKFTGKLYDSVSNSKGTSSYKSAAKKELKKIKKEKFIELFKTRNPVFVLAVLDTAKTKRTISEIDKFNSNIAKFSLYELVKNMRKLAIDFEILEL